MVSTILENSFSDQLHQRFGDRIQVQVPLKNYTTLRIGGPARWLLEAQDASDIMDAYRLALSHEIAFYFLAGCSNVLVSDQGLNGLVVINKTQYIEWHDGGTLCVASGYNLDHLAEEISQRGWADLSFAAGIPGSIGGALAGGAGAFGHLVCEYLDEARILLRDGTIENQSREKMEITYRNSGTKSRREMILDAVLGPFPKGDAKALMAACRQIRAEREIKHPGPTLPSAGSFFKNLPPKEPGAHRIPAGKLLEEVDAKSLRVGDAGVFEKHANILVNLGNATAEDIHQLANEMAQRVWNKFGITLEREVQFLC